jgi:alpha-ribazole phosphatase/probable phosphoglycerate mutase
VGAGGRAYHRRVRRGNQGDVTSVGDSGGGARRRDDGLAAVFTSDLRRAVQKAGIAFAGNAIPVYVDPQLRECGYGDWNGAPVARLEPERLAASTCRSPADRATGTSSTRWPGS